MILPALLLLSLIVLALFGDAVLRLCRFRLELPPWQYPFFAFWVGQALGTMLIWLIGLAGVPMWRFAPSLLIIFTIAAHIFLFLAGKKTCVGSNKPLPGRKRGGADKNRRRVGKIRSQKPPRPLVARHPRLDRPRRLGLPALRHDQSGTRIHRSGELAFQGEMASAERILSRWFFGTRRAQPPRRLPTGFPAPLRLVFVVHGRDRSFLDRLAPRHSRQLGLFPRRHLPAPLAARPDRSGRWV